MKNLLSLFLIGMLMSISIALAEPFYSAILIGQLEEENLYAIYYNDDTFGENITELDRYTTNNALDILEDKAEAQCAAKIVTINKIRAAINESQ